jgi:hypothetical protein
VWRFMKPKVHSDRSFEFYFPDLDTLVLVEDAEDRVIIRATRNSFSDRRKTHFIRRLAAEGFIPDHYQWTSSVDSEWSQVCWMVDASWVRVHKGNTVRTRRFMIRLLASMALIWLGIMAAVLFHWI